MRLNRLIRALVALLVLGASPAWAFQWCRVATGKSGAWSDTRYVPVQSSGVIAYKHDLTASANAIVSLTRTGRTFYAAPTITTSTLRNMDCGFVSPYYGCWGGANGGEGSWIAFATTLGTWSTVYDTAPATRADGRGGHGSGTPNTYETYSVFTLSADGTSDAGIYSTALSHDGSGNGSLLQASVCDVPYSINGISADNAGRYAELCTKSGGGGIHLTVEKADLTQDSQVDCAAGSIGPVALSETATDGTGKVGIFGYDGSKTLACIFTVSAGSSAATVAQDLGTRDMRGMYYGSNVTGAFRFVGLARTGTCYTSTGSANFAADATCDLTLLSGGDTVSGLQGGYDWDNDGTADAVVTTTLGDVYYGETGSTCYPAFDVVGAPGRYPTGMQPRHVPGRRR